MDSQARRTPAQVMVVDDHAGFREAVRSLLSIDGRLEVCMAVGSAEAALDALAGLGAASERSDEVRPDLVLMDVNMPGMNGIVAAGILVERHPGIRVVVCSTMSAASLSPLPDHPDVTFVPKDRVDADVLWAWLSRDRV